MKPKLLFAVFGSLLLSSVALAESPMDKYLSNIKVFDNEDGRYFETFEDVDLNFNPFQKRNKPYPIVNKSTIPEGKVYEETAQKYFKDFSSHAVLTEEEISFKDFLNEHFYLSNRNDETEIYRLANFPLEQNINNPGTSTFYLCMDSNYEYVKKFKPFNPDYINGRKPVYSNFKEKLLKNSTIVEAEEVNNNDNFVSVYCKDRTPPIITFKDTANTFVENLGSAHDYKSLIKEPALRPYYTIYSIDDKTIKNLIIENSDNKQIWSI